MLTFKHKMTTIYTISGDAYQSISTEHKITSTGSSEWNKEENYYLFSVIQVQCNYICISPYLYSCI